MNISDYILKSVQTEPGKRLTLAAFEEELRKLAKDVENSPPPVIMVVNYGLACADAPRPNRPFAIGDKVRVGLKIGSPTIVQCRPGVITEIKGHMGPGYAWVSFPDRQSAAPGAWFEHEMITLEEDQPMPNILKRFTANVDAFPRQIERAVKECQGYPGISAVQVVVGPATMQAMREGTFNPPDLGSVAVRIDPELLIGDVAIEEAPR